ncbi:uncharacterized protein LOC130668139 [Microplitis mediator]|uniref:uncharacterized protein LOC130668139 n=1 Tax=Microplitis mediator TaxID=375433 RepID=UPI0025573840|nr:uncharacterized protein LOC130668139 [Microplitis mediator]
MDDVKFKSNIDQDSYDDLIDNAHNKLQGLMNTSELDNQLENIMQLKQIMKCLLEYPHNRYNQHGIDLEYDKATMKVTVSSNKKLYINKLINNETVLEIWINRKNESDRNERQTSEYIQVIIFSIIKYLIKHAAKMQKLKIRVSTKNTQAINSSLCYDLFKAKCNTEISLCHKSEL